MEALCCESGRVLADGEQVCVKSSVDNKWYLGFINEVKPCRYVVHLTDIGNLIRDPLIFRPCKIVLVCIDSVVGCWWPPLGWTTTAMGRLVDVSLALLSAVAILRASIKEISFSALMACTFFSAHTLALRDGWDTFCSQYIWLFHQICDFFCLQKVPQNSIWLEGTQPSKMPC